MNGDRILCLGFIPRRAGWGAAAPHTRFSVPAVRRSLSGSVVRQTKPAIFCRVFFEKCWAKTFVEIRLVWGLICWHFCLYNFLNFLIRWLDIFSMLTVGNKPVPSLRQEQSCGSSIIYSGSGFYVSNQSGFGWILSNHYGSDQAAKVQIFKSDHTQIRILPFKSFRITDPSGSDQARKLRIQIHIIRDSTVPYDLYVP